MSNSRDNNDEAGTFMMQRGQSVKRLSGSRSLRLLVVAVVTYAISAQFKSAYRKLETPKFDYEQVELAPPGARRWGSQQRDTTPGKSGEENLSNNSLRGESSSLHDDDIDEDAPTIASTWKKEDAPTTQKQNSPSRRLPRTIAIDDANGTLSATQQNVNYNHSKDFLEDSMPEDPPRIEPNWYEANAEEFIDGYDWNVCEPMYDWQFKSYPNCNNFHELDLLDMRMINKGGSRIAFEMRQELDGREAKFVYKTVKYKKEITMKLAEEQRRDSLVLERTSSSDFIPDIHGYCSVGVMMDYMPDGNMHDYIKGARLAGGSTLPPVDRLRLSIHIAASVADLHTIDGTPMPSVFHNDICCHQYLFQDGIFKLNDFNFARPIYINNHTNEQCTRTGFGMAMWKGRSFEELHKSLRPDDFKPVKPDVIDIWMMGDLIYYMLTDLYTFEKPNNLSWQDSGWELLAGRRSPYPEHIENSNDRSHIAVKKALDMCWTQDWKKRPSARSISDYLIGQLKEITKEENPDFRVVLPERDPNQGHTESDYNEHND